MTLAEFWPLCLRLLHNELSKQQFKLAIAPLTVGVENGTWWVYAKNHFALNLLRSQYTTTILGIQQKIAPHSPKLHFKVGVGTSYPMASGETASSAVAPAEPVQATLLPNDFLPPSPPPKPKPPKPKPPSAQEILAARMNSLRANNKPPAPTPPPLPHVALQNAKAREEAEKRHRQTNLSPEYSFQTLVEGEGNHLAVAIAKNIAEKPGDSMYNPFFVYGSTGLGKTHLVQAIGNTVLEKMPRAKARYVHADEYLKNFMVSARNRTWDNFKQQYLQYNLLIIDDIQFIQGKDRTMEEFLLLFEHFHSRNQQIILTSDQLPSHLPNMAKRLVSRFSWGMTIRLEPPELQMRVNILAQKANAVGVTLHESAALFIAQNIKQNVRELEGALNRVLARCRFENRFVIDMDLATSALQDLISNQPKPITVELIMKEVANYHQIRVSDLLGKTRARSVARPRQMAMAMVKELTNMSCAAIGEAFGGRDHTTVVHAIKNIKQLIQDDSSVQQDYQKLMILIQH